MIAVLLLVACRPSEAPPTDGSPSRPVPTGATGLPTDTDTDTGAATPVDPWPPTEAFTLLAPLQSLETSLLDGDGEIVHNWVHAFHPGVGAELTPAGELIRSAALPEPLAFEENRGGTGGAIEILDADGALLWWFELANDRQLLHHDFEVLPNGNLLVLSFVARDEAELVALGRDPALVGPVGSWGEEVLEVCRQGPASTCTDGEIVWRWSVWDHVVQDRDPSAAGFVPDVYEVPTALDIDRGASPGVADWLHVNAVDYEAATDRVLLSARELDEVWIIDRSTGEISTRWGPGLLYGQHDPHWIPEGLPGAGHVLLFNNGPDRPEGAYSSVEEWCVPPECGEPVRVWLYEEGLDGDLYASTLSSVQRLPDGATAICEGPTGELREVEADGTVRWQAKSPFESITRALFRCPRYLPDFPGLP